MKIPVFLSIFHISEEQANFLLDKYYQNVYISDTVLHLTLLSFGT
jgi:hypothetical protein